MSTTNLYLPQKVGGEITYTITTPSTKTWTAPNALNSGASYQITIQFWSGGAGGGRGNFRYYGGQGGGGGCYVYSKVTVIPGTVYTFYTGAGGAGVATGGGLNVDSGAVGGNGSSSYIADGSGAIVGGYGGNCGTRATLSTRSIGGVGGVYFNSQPAKTTGNLSITGGAGGNGSNANDATAGGSAANSYGQPGGSGGASGTNTYNGSGGGSGASSQNSGATGGTNIGPSPGDASTGGGAGGAGYLVGTGGTNSSGANWNAGGSGAGGNGRITFLFVTANGGSSGSAPA
jgi:hypothetical protein